MIPSLDRLLFGDQVDFQNEKAAVQNETDETADVLNIKVLCYSFCYCQLHITILLTSAVHQVAHSLVLERGSLGPSTVTLIAFA